MDSKNLELRNLLVLFFRFDVFFSNGLEQIKVFVSGICSLSFSIRSLLITVFL